VDYRKLSVIVPVYNELNTVAEAIRRARSVDLPLDRELIVVDDGSTDGTGDLLPTLADSKVRVVSHPTNRGKTAAIRTGLAHATGDLVVIQDADLEYDPEDWARLLAPILDGRARVAYGSRFNGSRRNMLFWSAFGNRFLCLVTNALYGSRLSDVETCYKLFDRQVLQSISLRSERFGFEPEVTAKLLRAGEPIYEVPISYDGRTRQEGKKISWRDGLESLRILIACRL
jgi:glycosyltransferase involved in cell wall biosynthesis